LSKSQRFPEPFNPLLNPFHIICHKKIEQNFLSPSLNRPRMYHILEKLIIIPLSGNFSSRLQELRQTFVPGGGPFNVRACRREC